MERKHNWNFKYLQVKIAYLINVPVIKLLPCTLNSTFYVRVAGAGTMETAVLIYYLVPCGFLLIRQLEGHWKIGRGKKTALPVCLLYLSLHCPAISLRLFINYFLAFLAFSIEFGQCHLFRGMSHRSTGPLLSASRFWYTQPLFCLLLALEVIFAS